MNLQEQIEKLIKKDNSKLLVSKGQLIFIPAKLIKQWK